MGYSLAPSPRDEAKKLIVQREALEREIQALVDVLRPPNGPGLRGNLVDSDGFPRADIDIVSVLAQRNRLAKLSTDLALLTDKIEELLHVVLARPEEDGQEGDTQSMRSQFGEDGVRDSSNAVSDDSGDKSIVASSSTETGTTGIRRVGKSSKTSFAIVDEVGEKSPAEAAGLQIGDKIVSFGDVTLAKSKTISVAMGALPSLLQENKNKEVDLQIHRRRSPTEEIIVDLKLTPTEWSGRGLLGCHIVPAPLPEDENYAPEVATATLQRRVAQ